MRQTIDWPMAVRVVEDDEQTRAELVLGTNHWFMDCSGLARRNPADEDVPEIGEELAVGRALVALGNRLITLAETGLGEQEGNSGR